MGYIQGHYHEQVSHIEAFFEIFFEKGSGPWLRVLDAKSTVLSSMCSAIEARATAITNDLHKNRIDDDTGFVGQTDHENRRKALEIAQKAAAEKLKKARVVSIKKA